MHFILADKHFRAMKKMREAKKLEQQRQVECETNDKVINNFCFEIKLNIVNDT